MRSPLQITCNPLFRPASIIGFKKPYVPCHYGVWDRYNQSLVLEFGPNGLNVFTNTLGVFTNNPLFPQQMQVRFNMRCAVHLWLCMCDMRLSAWVGGGVGCGTPRAATGHAVLGSRAQAGCPAVPRCAHPVPNPAACRRARPRPPTPGPHPALPRPPPAWTLQYYNAWTTKITSPPYSVPPLNPTIHGTTFYPPPGSYNSSDRFTRLAVLKYAAGRAPWHAATDPISPGFALKSSSNPALITALDLIQSVYLPKGGWWGGGGNLARRRPPATSAHAGCAAHTARCAPLSTAPAPAPSPPCAGVDDSGGTGPKETDWTIFTTLRDHTKAVYYWRVANSPRWSKVSLRRVDWATLRSQKKVGARLMVGYPEWADDKSNGWA